MTYCDCCGEPRPVSRCWAAGIETFACDGCRGIERADYDEDCSCRTPLVRSTDIDPPEPHSIRDPWCPVHGRDPDEAYEEARDRSLRDY